MKLFRILMLSLAAVFFLGCPGDPIDPPPPPKQDALTFRWSTNNPVAIGTGDWGRVFGIIVRSDYGGTLKGRYIFSGPGIIGVVDTSSPRPYEFKPLDLSEELTEISFYAVYRPPTNAEVPPEGVFVTIAFEAFNPRTNKWERSTDYQLRVVHPTEPMVIRLSDQGNTLDTSKAVTVIAGEVYKFHLSISPPFYEDIQFKCSLLSPDHYSGRLGELALEPDLLFYELSPPRIFSCAYTAPEGITSPTDIIARFSYLDPWVKEIQEHELTITVVPKE